jgi:hypothetical protein
VLDVAHRVLGPAQSPDPFDGESLVQRGELNVETPDGGRLLDRELGQPPGQPAVTLHAVDRAEELQDLGSDLAACRRQAERLLGEGAAPVVVGGQHDPP